jgi:hypothetical protein
MDGTDQVWNVEVLKKVLANAEQGATEDQLFMGVAATIDPLPNFSRDDAAAMLLKAAQGGQPRAQRFIGLGLYENAKCSEEEKGKWEPWLRAAARAGDNVARVELASIITRNDLPSADAIKEAKLLLEAAIASDDPYAVKHAVAYFAASPIESLRNPALALTRTDFLLREETVGDPATHEVIAAANAANGKFDAALKSQQRALEKANRLHWDTSLMTERLVRYQSHELWTGDLFELPSGGP